MTDSPRFVVIPAEMFILSGRQTAPGKPGQVVDALLCVGWDDETARAAGWPRPVGNDNAVT